MKLGYFEKFIVNSPLRANYQRSYVGRHMASLGGLLPGANVLEIGCGRGLGVEVLFDRFGVSEVTAFDVDPAMLEEARKRLERYGPARVRLSIGDAEVIDAPAGSFDAVFDFAVLHHVPDWRRALAEIQRVLVPGGRFYFEEIVRPKVPTLAEVTPFRRNSNGRPHDFSAADFENELGVVGLTPTAGIIHRFAGCLVIGAAAKATASASRDQQLNP
jgi:ubiquinone/menaquinone biosynthesis C-methylase UbiE